MIRPTDILSKEELGIRLRIAREAQRITQAEAAAAVEMSRTTLLSIEQGKRPLKGGELKALTDLYKISMNQLLRRDAIHVDLVPRFRKLPDAHLPGVEGAAAILNQLASAEVELENLLGLQRATTLPPERPLLPGDVRKQAENDALELRRWLGLGMNPVRDMLSLLEFDLGVRVYIRPLKAKVSGLFAYDDQIGACLLLNAAHPIERQNQTMAHETGHIVATRRRPEVFSDSHHHDSREERYADTFGRVFLMPPRAVAQKFSDMTAGATKLTRRHVVLLAHYFCVSREAIVRRLEELDLAARGTWDWFEQYGGISNAQAEEVLGTATVEQKNIAPSRVLASLRLDTLAAAALGRGLVSEGQLAGLLRVDRADIRKLEDELEGGDDAVFQLP